MPQAQAIEHPPNNIDTLPIPSNPSKKAAKGIPIELIRHLVETKGYNYTQVAETLDCDVSNISRRCKEHNIGKNSLQLFRSAKIDILDSKLEMVLNSITPEKVKKASSYQLTGMANYFHQMVRLENEQSTANISYADLTREIKEIEGQERELARQLGVKHE